jgi:hypothetical protein
MIMAQVREPREKKMGMLREMVSKLDAEDTATREKLEQAIDNALALGVRASMVSALTDSQPVILLTRLNYTTRQVECSHPDTVPPVFEPVRDVLTRMIEEAELASSGVSIN